MACTYTYQGKTYNAWEFADLLASMPVDELAGFLPSDALSNIKSMASKSSAPEAINVAAVESGARFDVDRAYRQITSKLKFSDMDTDPDFEVTVHNQSGSLLNPVPHEFVFSTWNGKDGVSLSVSEQMDDDGNLVFSSSLEAYGDQPKGTGIATKMYLSALNVAQKRGIGWMSEGVRSDESLAMYRRLKEAGIPFVEVGNASYISAEDLKGVDLQAVADRIASKKTPAKSIVETIEVDGVERPTRNSTGQLIHPTEEGVRNFWRWFGDGEHIDGDGRPILFRNYGGKFETIDPNVGRFGGVFVLEASENLDAEYHTRSEANYLYLRGETASTGDIDEYFRDIKYGRRDEQQEYDFLNKVIGRNVVDDDNVEDIAESVTNEGSLENIKSVTGAKDGDDFAVMQKIRGAIARRLGFGSVHIEDEYSGDTILIVGNDAAKSATGNIGAFDPKNPSIQASISFSPLDYIERLERSDSLISQKIGSILGKTVELGKDVIGADSAKTFNWWHKTVGSQMHKAKVSPEFRRVFNRAQAFIDDVSKYATVAANEAPDLLPKMDSFFQAVRDATNSIKDAKDQEAIAAPIFEGTLFEDVGKVWTDDELRDRYSLTDRQIKLYRQFRAAVDKSLDDLAISEMNKVARANELIDPPSGSHMTLDRLASFYRGQYADKLAALNAEYDRISAAFEANDAQLKLNAERLGVSREKYFETKTQMHADYAEKQRALLAEMEELQRMENVFSDKVKTINKLKRQGYAPLMRFGKYTVDVVEMVDAIDEESGLPVTDQETGEIKQVENRIFFSMFETEREAREAERIMMEEYPQAKVTRGVNSEDGWQLFGKVNEGTLEALKEMIPSQDEVMQSFYKMAVSNRSALKRLIHRKGTEGYSKDVVRTLASFIMSNARASASFDHFGDIVEAAMEIPKEQGDVQEEAVKLINYIRDPNEEAGKFRGLLFMHFLGGSIASALVNLTQTISTTVPFLHQYGANVSDITKAGVLAAKRMKGGEATGIDRDLARALQLAEDEGIVAPHNIHALMGQTGTQGIAQHNRWFRLASHMWGSFFGMAEQFNRETAFISAYQLAKRLGDKGLKDAYDQQVKLNSDRGLPPPDRKIFSGPFEFAKNAVFETQFVLSKASRPNWARGAVGATLFTFKQFSVMYLELFNRLPNKERAIMLGALVLLAGIGGLPFGDDLEDLIDTMGQSAGYNTNSGKWKDDLIRDLLGNNKVASEFVLNGVTAFLPMDVANRLGMGNLLPATGLLKRSNGGNFGKEMSEFLGAGGAYARQIVDAWTAYQNTGRMSSLLQVAPKAIKDAAKGFEIASTGEYTDTRGRLVAEANGIDALVKALGFQPVDIAAIQREKGYQMQDIALVKAVKASIAEMWARGVYNKEPETKQRARELLEEWNTKNPEAKIRIELGAVQRRVKQMGMTAAERLEKTAPKEMRRQVREAFAE